MFSNIFVSFTWVRYYTGYGMMLRDVKDKDKGYKTVTVGSTDRIVYPHSIAFFLNHCSLASTALPLYGNSALKDASNLMQN